MYVYIYIYAQYIYIRWTAIPFENLVVLGRIVRTLGKKIGLTEVLKRHSSDLEVYTMYMHIYIHTDKNIHIRINGGFHISGAIPLSLVHGKSDL